MSIDDVDLYDPQTQEDWYPAYETLREEAPVYRVPGTKMFVVTPYEDVAFESRRTDVFLNGPASGDALVQHAEALRICREEGRPKRSVFGQGEHHCPGAGLPRLEQVIAFQSLLDRVDGWRFTPGRNDFHHQPGFVLRALDHLHLTFDAAGSTR